MGFDGVCVNEHHNNAYGIMPSPNLMAATLIRRPSNAAIVVLGNSLALYNPPIRVAEEFAMLDVASGGRLVPPAYGREFADRIDGARLHTVADAGHL